MDEAAYRELLGAERVRLKPGLRLALPLLHEVRRVPLGPVKHDLGTFMARTKDGAMLQVCFTAKGLEFVGRARVAPCEGAQPLGSRLALTSHRSLQSAPLLPSRCVGLRPCGSRGC
jgi:hypothetical protein